MNRLPNYGFTPDMFEGGVTSGEEGFQYMMKNDLAGKKTVLLGWNGADSDGFLEALGLDYSSPSEADFLLCHGPDTIVDDNGTKKTGMRNSGEVDTYEEVFKVGIERGLPMINVNPDITVNSPEGGLWYMPGLLAMRYKAMGGEVRFFGKPYVEHYQAAVDKMALPKERIVHVGDSLAHDIVGAETSGVDSLFVAGGIHGKELGVDAAKGTSPFSISTHALCEVFRKEGVTPTWTIPRLEW
ncbi:unnamed protein product [Choristocarpus tenellus]